MVKAFSEFRVFRWLKSVEFNTRFTLKGRISRIFYGTLRKRNARTKKKKKNTGN